MVDLLELTQRIGVQGAVAPKKVQLAQELRRLPGKQLAPDRLFSSGLPRTHASSPVSRVHGKRAREMDLFVVCAPGLEPIVSAEMATLGIRGRPVAGGVETTGGLDELYRLNLWLRTATRILVRLGQVRATTFAELVRKASALPFETVVRPGQRVAFRVTCHKSRLYHSAAVAQRLHEAMERRLGGSVQLVQHDEAASDPPQLFVARFDHDVCTVSPDSSGVLLHRRGYRMKEAQAPLRETLAAAMLLAAGYTGTDPLLDPMCGSGTIPIEAALIARRRAPGLTRGFAFERWPRHDARGLDELRA